MPDGASAAIIGNGASLNGITLNGMLNGIMPNGIVGNGSQLQGADRPDLRQGAATRAPNGGSDRVKVLSVTLPDGTVAAIEDGAR